MSDRTAERKQRREASNRDDPVGWRECAHLRVNQETSVPSFGYDDRRFTNVVASSTVLRVDFDRNEEMRFALPQASHGSAISRATAKHGTQTQISQRGCRCPECHEGTAHLSARGTIEEKGGSSGLQVILAKDRTRGFKTFPVPPPNFPGSQGKDASC